jgi:excisionase family DNA binding protein
MKEQNQKQRRDNGSGSTYPSVDALAAELGISRQAAYSGLRNKTIPHIRIGKRFIIPRSAIADWLRAAGKHVAVER